MKRVRGQRIMNKSFFTGAFLVVLLISSLVIAGCAGAFSGNDRGKCAEGDSCRFYTGTRGVMMYLDRPITKMYYRSSDFGQADENTFELNVRLANDGASDSYGAVFLTGFSGEMFDIYTMDGGAPKKIEINRNRNSCYFDTQTIGRSIGDWNFLFSCFGGTLETLGGTNSLSLSSTFFKTVSDKFGWNIPIDNLDIAWNENGILDFGIGTDRGVMNFGRSLMLIVSSLNFENSGGSVFTMKGDNAAYPGGDIDYKTFKVQMTSRWPAGQDYFRIPYEIKSCYAYTTFVSPDICIDPDPFSEEKKLCTSELYTWSGSQGAPVAVTRLQQTNTGKEIIIDMTIKNVGTGRVWDVGYLEGCSPYYPGKVTPRMLNVVYIGYAYIGDHALDCTNYYQVRLDPNTREARLTCRYDMSEASDIGSAYVIPLKMELWYGYEESITQQLTIRKLN
jgi:hypothetical protein